MSISKGLLKFYYSQNNKYSIRINWHQQHLLENIMDLQDFMLSNSAALEEDHVKVSALKYPLGYFQIEQSSRIRYSHVVFLFTIFERRVRALLNLIFELKSDLQKDISNYRGSFLEKIKQFLHDNLEINLVENSAWQDIMTFQKVRDCIIHCGGNINESRDKIYFNKLAEQSKINLNSNNYILLNNEFCKNMESSIINFVVDGLDVFYNILCDMEVKKNNL